MVSGVSLGAILRLTHNVLIGSTEISYLLPAAILSVYAIVKQSRRVELCQHLVTIAGETHTTVRYHAIQPYRSDVLDGSQTAIREMLAKMTENSFVASSLLAWILGSANDAAARPAKRARLERYAELYCSLTTCSWLEQRTTLIQRASAHL